MIINIIFQINKEDKLHSFSISLEQDIFHQRIQITFLDLGKTEEINFKTKFYLLKVITKNNLIKTKMNNKRFHPLLWITNTLII